MSAELLLLEDDPAIAETVVFALERDGFQVRHVRLVRDARSQLAAQCFDALILDIGLPDGSGLDLCRELRQQVSGDQHAHASVPMLILSARGEELDRVLGLEVGADDYVTKPFSPRELVARVKALLRRASSPALQPAARASGDFAHDASGQRIRFKGQALDLTRREYALLAKLIEAKGRILSREVLFDAAWGLESDSGDRTVDTHIKTLRAKLRAIDASRDVIVTHRGMGYSLAA
jgi:two-component system, OmpR family, catabolic regulation response regulator CreB